MTYRDQLLATLCLMAACSGCVSGGHGGVSQVWAGLPPVALDSREVQRQDFVVDVSAVGTLPPETRAEGDGFAPPPAEEPLYALGETDVQQMGADRAVLAQLLLQESDAVGAQSTPLGMGREAIEVLQVALQSQAVAERNRAAASALQAWLGLVEAEDGLNRLRASGKELEGMKTDLDNVRKEGIAVSVTPSEIERQALDLFHQREGVKATVQTLNQQLADLLALDATPQRIWPDVDLAVQPEALDIDTEVGMALGTRSELALLRYLSCSLNSRTLPAIRQILGASNAALGATTKSKKCFQHAHGQSDDDEIQQRQAQIQTMLEERERMVVREVRVAIAEIDTRILQIASSKGQLQAQQQRVQDLQQQQTVGAATPLEVRRARLDVIKAEQQLLHDAVQWKLAVVKLKTAQGLLAAECGYYPPTGSCGQ